MSSQSSIVSTKPKVKKSSAWTAEVMFWKVGVYPLVGVGVGVGVVDVGLVVVVECFEVVVVW